MAKSTTKTVTDKKAPAKKAAAKPKASSIDKVSEEILTKLKSLDIEHQLQADIEIKKDIVLVNLDCEDINVTYARLFDDYDRAKKLLSSGAGSKESYEKSKSLFNEIEVKKSWCLIKSPIDGVITNSYREVGEYVTRQVQRASVYFR